MSHFRFHKFNYSFQDELNTVCNRGTFETTIQYPLYCPNFSDERQMKDYLNKCKSNDEIFSVKISKSDLQISYFLTE